MLIISKRMKKALAQLREVVLEKHGQSSIDSLNAGLTYWNEYGDDPMYTRVWLALDTREASSKFYEYTTLSGHVVEFKEDGAIKATCEMPPNDFEAWDHVIWLFLTLDRNTGLWSSVS